MTYPQTPSEAPFRVLIVGGGIAGLSLAAFLRRRTKFHIQLIERIDLHAPSLADIDYGIAIASNGTAVLSELGMQDHAKELRGCELTQMSTCPAESPPSSSQCQAFPTRSMFGSPTIFSRRSVPISWLLTRCTEEMADKAEVELISPCRITSLDVERGIAYDDQGASYSGNLLVCADGIDKTGARAVREAVNKVQGNCHDDNEDGGKGQVIAQAAYMAVIPFQYIQDRPCLNHLFINDGDNEKHGTLSNWIYDDVSALQSNDTALASRLQRRIIMYPLDDQGNLQLFAYIPASQDILERFGRGKGQLKRPPSSIIRGVSSQEAVEMFEDFHIDVNSLLGLSPTVDLCLIRDSGPLSNWSFKDKVVMIGDAAHATIPHTGQGFSQSLEDAEALSYLLSRLPLSPSSSEIQAALSTFEKIRIPRSHEVQLTSRLLNGTREGLEKLDMQGYSARILAGWKRTEMLEV